MSGGVQWKPTKEGYLQFLVESRALFQTLEDIVMECSHSECVPPARNLPSSLSLFGSNPSEHCATNL